MTADLAHATPWGATHHHTDLGVEVHWIHWDAPEGGVDATPMVLVHGLGGSHTNWLEVGQMWSQHREVFALDLRGFGLTAGHPADTAVLANRDLVVAFLEHVVRRPAIVVGNSMGGMISTFVTRSRPDLVAGLVLVDPALPAVPVRPDPVVASRFAVFALPGVAEAGLRRARQTLPPRVLAEQVAALVFADRSKGSQAVMDVNVEVATRRGAIDGAMGDIDRSFTRAARSLLVVVGRPRRYAAHLAALPGPVLLLHGDKDRLVSVEAARRTARANPDWDYVEFAGVGHVPQMEVPQSVAAVVDEWIERRVEGTSAAGSDE